MPGTANDSNSLKALFLGLPDGFAHPGFAQHFQSTGWMCTHELFAYRTHGLMNSLENGQIVGAMLNQIFPPAFTIAETGTGREQTERVGPISLIGIILVGL